jgi:hypothetical protein
MPAFEIEAVEEALGQNFDKELEEDFAKIASRIQK